MSFTSVQCFYCKNSFLKENRHINENIKHGHSFYCSIECQYSAKNKQKELICENPDCRNKFRRSLKHIYFHNFCSRKCYGVLVTLNNKLRRRPYYCDTCGKKVTSNRKYCSPACWAYAHRVPKSRIVNQLKVLSLELGRTPTRREFRSYGATAKQFGSWANALLTANLTPHRSLNQRMYRRKLCIANDGHKCNSVSELIIDNWLHKHKLNHQKEVSYPQGKFVADWALSPNILIEFFGLANDSKRYDEEIKKKQTICKNLGITLIEIYSKDLFPENKLDQIFK